MIGRLAHKLGSTENQAGWTSWLKRTFAAHRLPPRMTMIAIRIPVPREVASRSETPERTIRADAGVTTLEFEAGGKRHHTGRQRAVEHAGRQTRLLAGGVPLKAGAHTVVLRMVEHVVGLGL